MNLDDLNVEKELKIVYMGTSSFSRFVLDGLLKQYKVRAVVTQPDRPSGRGEHLKQSPVKELALEKAILTLQPNKIREEYQEILDLEPDLIITCAYGQIIPEVILECPRLGCINVHASLLPKLRGGAPIQRAIMNGFKETGVTIMYMNNEMDKGDMISSCKVEIEETDTADSLHDKLMVVGTQLLIDTLPSIIAGTNNREVQNEFEATYGFIIKKEDEKIDFSKTKREIYNQIRGLNSHPGAYCNFNGKIIKVWESYQTDNVYSGMVDGQITKIYPDGIGVKVSNGEIVLKTIQPEGKGKMSGNAFANGILNKPDIKKIFT